MSNIKQRLHECFQTIFVEMAEKQVETASISSHAEWDSLATINLISLIEEEFDLKIPAEGDVNFSSFELILDYLEENVGA